MGITRRSIVAGVVLFCLLVAACSSLKGRIGGYTDGRGTEVCIHLSEEMQSLSSHWSVASWSCGIIASILLALGGVLGAGDKDARWHRRTLGVLLATIGGSLAATSAFSVSRSNAASAAAASAATAITRTDDLDRYNQCVLTRARWLESRSDSLDAMPPPQSKGHSQQGEQHGAGGGHPGDGR